ncbi:MULTISPECIES: hypothetical protein [Cryobacterium]|uniref:Hemagglutinin n=1 Tax=Cryobacterium breve TaxID=1259258 RepID=A0ABY2JA68_9MICO|nr:MULTISPECIES: hypothetical protein [Cryobacterium]TFC90421.1 hypothetical protein E3T20_16425 [Cryobacterium sp. TmT3-12]TFD01838.1 hypothetical protein E3O65_00620 [Cryobacterium breve]
MKRRRFIGMTIVATLLGSLLGFVGTTSAQAADGRQFDPGNIISDAVFFDGGIMNSNDVQAFLNSKVSTCRSGYTCLKDYRQATPTRAGVSGACAAYGGRSSESAADIIARVGVACGISQKALIVLIEKEQGLITDDWPSDRQYRSATGYGCPDTADCDTAYYGFFNQVYAAALQFKYYAANPTRWNHIAGRVNNIRFHPNAGCGTSQVFIQNQATAGLYNYTPYQPNSAALGNLYGSGDGCSSYGNRNFWRMYSDWFGSPINASSLLRTNSNASVYLVSGSNKYPIASMGVLNALSPLGQVGYVSQSYLDSFTTKHVVGRSLRAPGGTIYFYDAGIKLPFTSCTQAADYGASCAADGYVQLTQPQIDAFHPGPVLGPVLGTVEGSRYYISAGTRREILDDRSQIEAGVPLGMNVLTENAVAHLTLAAPIVRDSVFVQARSTSDYSIVASGQRSAVSGSGKASAGLPGRSAGSLYASSLNMVPSSGADFNGVLRSPGSSSAQIVSGSGRFELTPGAGGSGSLPSTAVSQEFVDSYAPLGKIDVGSLIKSPDSGTVFLVMQQDIRPIDSWAALLALTPGGGSPVISTVSSGFVAALPQGVVALYPGALVRSANDATVYLINGVTNRIPFSSFDIPNEAGFKTFAFVSSERLAAYPLAPENMSFGITCDSKNYVAAGGSLHPLTEEIAPLYPFKFTALDNFSCQNTTIGSPATKFIRTPDGSIYLLDAGQKRVVNSMARFAELGGSVGWLSVLPSFAGALPTGPVA